MEFIESPIYLKLSREEKEILNNAATVLTSLIEAAESKNCDWIGVPFNNERYCRFDVDSAACICHLFAQAEKLEISN